MRNDFHNSIAYFCHLCTYVQMTVLECIEKFTILRIEWQISRKALFLKVDNALII